MFKNSYMSRFLFIVLALFLVDCKTVTDKEAVVDQSSEETALIEALSASDLAAKEAAKEAVFESLLSKAIDQRFIDADDKEAQELLHRFFPNTARFQNHDVSIEPIAARDSFWLLLYEFVTEKEEKNQIFLGSFSKTGYVVDLLELQSISFDGHLSISLLEEDILEIEYRDFMIRPGFPNIQANHLEGRPQVLPVRSKATQQGIYGAGNKERTGTKYFHILTDGSFVSLATSDRDDIARVFPQVSSRILSVEELERLKPGERELMRKELYACYGFASEDELSENYFNEKGWYQKEKEVDLDKLSEIEKINLSSMMNLK
jgi:hypothetical protein